MYNFAERDDLTELAVVVPGWQAQALEEAAHREGLTGGQLLRRLLNNCFSRQGVDLDLGRGLGHFAENLPKEP